MGIYIIKKIEDYIRDSMQNIDYLIYLLVNPFKFKSFPKSVKRILVVELLNYGDLIVSTPTLKALKQHFKDAEIDVLIKQGKEDVLKGNKNIKQCIPYVTFSRTKDILREKKYDLGIMLHPGSWKISLLLLLGKVKYRIGGTKTGITYGKGFFLNKKIFPNNKEQHKIEDNLDVIRSIGIETKDKHLELFPSTVAEKRIKKILKKYPRPWIGINAASAHYSQRWYKEKWKEVIEYYQKRKATIIMMGVKQERDQVQSILNELSNVKGTVNLTGKTTFDEFMSLIKNLDLLITIDSSATHIASAFDKPVLTLFGPTIPTFWGPTGKSPAYIWKEEGCVGCRRYFCIYNKGYECMRSITPDEVITKARTLLKK